ncbi:MAG: SRPBCC family protein [Acidimicrobiales bacterium]
MPAVVRSIEIEARPSEVWQWVADQGALRRWLGESLEIDLRVGGAYRLLGPDHETSISGVVLDLVPEGALILSWLEEDAGWAHPARLVLTLEATATGTKVCLVHDGFAGIGKEWAGALDAYERGADRHLVLKQLADLVTSGSA